MGAFGKNSDAGIFRNSIMGKRLMEGNLNMPPPKRLPESNVILPHVIIGDEAFPLTTFLMRPYSRDDAQGDEEKKVFNYRLSRARNTVENCFGILTRKFRLFERKLSMSHEHVVCVVMATCCLHNFLRNDACQWTENDQRVFLSGTAGLQRLRGTGGVARHDALNVRNTFKTYVNSEVGSVEWQLARVRAGRRLP